MARRGRFSREPEVSGVRSMTHEGRGVADRDGKTVFIDGALPGETVEWQRMRAKRRFDEAAVLRVIEPSPDRVTPACDVFGACGGCVMQHLSNDGQLSVKHQVLVDSIERIGLLEPSRWLDPVAAQPWHYRRRARLGVRYVDGKSRVLVGFRERYKPYITDMQSCPVLVEPVAALIEPLARLIEQLSIARQLPQIEVAVGDGESVDALPVVVMILRVLEAPSESDLGKLRAFSEAYGIWFALQPGGLDSIEGLARADGSEAPELVYHLPDWGLTLRFEASDFIQVNASINIKMIRQTIELIGIKSSDRVLDLYSGIGNFSLPLATLAAEVHGVEGAVELTTRAAENARRNGIDNVSFATSDLSEPDAIDALANEPWDLVLLDPARAGAEVFAAKAAQFSTRRIVYVSCHPGTLARDAALIAAQGYSMTAAGILNMFPHTAHVESMAVFDRSA